jgi:hypothetical protein
MTVVILSSSDMAQVGHGCRVVMARTLRGATTTRSAVTVIRSETEERRGQPAVLVWASVGFGVAEAEQWRAAGWTDPMEAARWRRLRGHGDPAQLRILAARGHEPIDVDRVASRSARHAPAWLAATVVTDGRGDERRDVALTMLDRLFPPDPSTTTAWLDRLQRSRAAMVSSAQRVAGEMADLQASAAAR